MQANGGRADISIIRLILAVIGKKAPKVRTVSARETVGSFAETFLDSEAQMRLHNPANAGYDAFDLLGIPTELDQSRYPDTLWGQLLLSELLEFSKRAIWLDWKFNVLTMVGDDPLDDQLGYLFKLYDVPAPSQEERQAILDEAMRLHGPQPQTLMLPELQQLAIERSYRLMVLENKSDGIALLMLPIDQAEQWHLTHLGDVLIVDAAARSYEDPRFGGKLVNIE